MVGIYKITNKVNGKCYIGKSKSIGGRWGQHINHLENNKHQNVELQYEFNIFGCTNFVFEIIELCEDCDLLKKEKYYINKFRENCYNVFNANKYKNNKEELNPNFNKRDYCYINRNITEYLFNFSVVTQNIILIYFFEMYKTGRTNIEISKFDYNKATGINSQNFYSIQKRGMFKELKESNIFSECEYCDGVLFLEIKEQYINKSDMIRIDNVTKILSTKITRYFIPLLLLSKYIEKNEISLDELLSMMKSISYTRFDMLNLKVLKPFIKISKDIGFNIDIKLIKKRNKIVALKFINTPQGLE